jgi:hypothetical protein
VDVGPFLLRLLRKLQQALAGESLILEPQYRQEAGLDRCEIRQAQILLKTTDLCIAVTDRDGQFRLRQSRAASKVPEELAESR